MGNLLDAILLGLVQGLTEFLPVSSSGHLALCQHLLGWEDPSENLAFNVAVHVGSLLAVLVFVRREIAAMFTKHPRLIAVLVVATLPLVGAVFLKDRVEELSTSLAAVGGFLVCTGVILVLVRRMGDGDETAPRLPFWKALFIGGFQLLAVLPGISRSGATLAAGLRMGLSREQAVRFAFLMAAPAIAGAGVFMLFDWEGEAQTTPMLAGAFVSFLSSLVAMKLMVAVVVRRRLGWFAAYCVAIGLIAIALG